MLRYAVVKLRCSTVLYVLYVVRLRSSTFRYVVLMGRLCGEGRRFGFK